MHQSAKDGYRSYLQAYASYSLKKIFDVNQLDLAKVGKAFGFAVPPRVNVSVGGGSGGAGRSGRKRPRDDDEGDGQGGNEEVWEEIDAVDKEEDENGVGEDGGVIWRRDGGKERRREALGRRKVDKEVYKKGLERKKMRSEGGAQWSR